MNIQSPATTLLKPPPPQPLPPPSTPLTTITTPLLPSLTCAFLGHVLDCVHLELHRLAAALGVGGEDVPTQRQAGGQAGHGEGRDLRGRDGGVSNWSFVLVFINCLLG